MSSWWTVIEGSGLQDCPQTLVNKLNGLSWITQAAWKRESNGFHIALACVFETAEAVKVKKRLQKEINPKQGPIGKQLPDANLKVIKLGTAGESFSRFYCEFVTIKAISEAIEPVPDTAPSEANIDDWAMLGLQPGASPEVRTRAYKEQALIWHPDKPTGYLRHFQALQLAYKRLAGIPDPEHDEIRTMTVEPKIPERITKAMAQARNINARGGLDRGIEQCLAQHLRAEELREGANLMIQYMKELEKATNKANNWSSFFWKAAEMQRIHHKQEQARELAKRSKASVRYWPPSMMMSELFEPTKNKSKTLRIDNEDLDPYVLFDKFFIMKVMPCPASTGKSVAVRVG